jgi:hypothetical protein
MRQVFGLPVWLVIVIALVICGCVFQIVKKTSSLESFSGDIPQGKNAKVKITNYWASWCGWSNKFKPEWDKFEASCNAAVDKSTFAKDFDCGDEKDEEAQAKCKASQVPGFPSVQIEYKEGGKAKKIDYEGERTAAGLKAKVDEILAVAE